MASSPEFNGEQLTAVRAARWRQNGDALLTLDAAREWVGELGLVLFAPRGHQMSTPAPSLVEATLGHAIEAPTVTQTETARGLVARMIADGTALPLNLLGGPGDLPDFVASAQVFSYIFTLRGDKAWKQPPSASGPAKVSPLAAKVYAVLAEQGALTATELVSELGRELTENAIARALSELWTQMRVIPLLQQDGSATMWELTSKRFTRAIKAGANAGQPTALSALVSLYLAQAFAATEEEIATFLSPLAARSRVREVLHGLTAGRQLEPVVLEGKTLLYIPGALPEFPQVPAPETEEAPEAQVAPPVTPTGEARIRSFAGRGRPDRDLRGRPERRFPAESSRQGGLRPPRRMVDQGEERRPRPHTDSEQKQSFTRPWQEERRPKRPTAEGRAEKPRFKREVRGERPRFNREDRAERPQWKREGGTRREFSRGGGEEHRPERGAGERKPFRPRKFEGQREGGERRPFKPRKFEGERENRRPGGFGARGPRPERSAEGTRPAGRANRRFEKPAEAGERPQGRPFRPRRREDERGDSRAPGRKFERGAKPGGFGGKRGYTPRGGEEGGRAASKRPFSPRTEGGAPFRPRSEGSAPLKKGFGGKRFGEGGPKFGRTGGKPGKKFGGRSTGPGSKRGGGAPRGKRRGPEAEE